MYATNSALVWKRMADENQQSAKFLARISVLLAVMVLAISAYAFSATSKYKDLCATIAIKSDNAASQPARELGQSIESSYCS